MNRYNYDFSGFERAMSHLKQRQDKATLNEIKSELNRFFKDSTCEEVIFTKNTDKLFFGMCTYAVLDDQQANQVFTDSNPIKINRYYIEIDSKILDIGLTKAELTAILLHEVGHLVNDTTPIETVRNAIDVYMEKNKTEISLQSIVGIDQFLKYVINDSIRKTISIFNRNDEEILADEFVVTCGYGKELETAYKKLVASMSMVNKNVSNKLVVLDWMFQIYKNMKMYRLVALKTLNKCKAYTGSTLEKKGIDNAINNLQHYTEPVRECKLIVDSIVIKEESTYINEDGLVKRIQRSGLKGLEEDVYEYMMRIRNVEDSDEAILLIRQINTRMSVLDDFLTNSNDLPEKERARWEKCYDKYYSLREELSKKIVYNKKNYGLWYDYNYIGVDNK